MTTTTTTTISQYCLIMGVTQDAGDNAVDVTYSTKPDQGGVTTLDAITASTTAQPFITVRVLKPIINNTVRPI